MAVHGHAQASVQNFTCNAIHSIVHALFPILNIIYNTVQMGFCGSFVERVKSLSSRIALEKRFISLVKFL